MDPDLVSNSTNFKARANINIDIIIPLKTLMCINIPKLMST